MNSLSDAAQLDRAAFDRTARARSLVALAAMPPYTLDAFYASGKALWTAPRLAPHRSAMLALPGFDPSHLDDLEDLARALRFAHTTALRRAQAPKAAVSPEVSTEAYDLRRTMLKYCDALADSRIVDPELVARVQAGSGYADLVEDLNVLVQELQSLPAGYTSPESAVPRSKLTRASELAHQINVAVGNAVDLDLSQAALVEERRKLAGLLLKSQSQLRRAITWLRWDEGDAAELVPSLYKTGKRTAAPEEAPPPDLAKLHEELHTLTATASVHPDDNPFTE